MIDLHYDLLTDIYCHIQNGTIEKLIEQYNDTHDDIQGGIFSLYFMSPQEMKDELSIDENEIQVTLLLKTVLPYLRFFNGHQNFLLTIEGCDYLEIDDLEELYELGIRSLLPCWNNPNQYGSGNRDTYGLTAKGYELVRKAVTMGMAIDLAHTNEKTFFDIVSYAASLKTEGFDPILFVSHANVRELCHTLRNLSNTQLDALKELDTVIGLMPHTHFVNEQMDHGTKEEFVQHIQYLRDYFGNVSHIAIGTDNMDTCIDPEFQQRMIFPINQIKEELTQYLEEADYTPQEIQAILFDNGKRILDKIRMKKS